MGWIQKAMGGRSQYGHGLPQTRTVTLTVTRTVALVVALNVALRTGRPRLGARDAGCGMRDAYVMKSRNEARGSTACLRMCTNSATIFSLSLSSMTETASGDCRRRGKT